MARVGVLFLACWQALVVAHDAGGAEADPHTEDMLAYRRKMGRWRRESHQTIKDPEFWLTLQVFAASHQPLEHALHFIHSKASQFKYASWVCGKSASILQEFGELIACPSWCLPILQAPGCDAGRMLELGVGLILLQHSSFKRRVHDLVSSYPSKALWLVHSPPGAACCVRQTIAAEILQSEEKNMQKLRRLCRADLQEAQETGRCSQFLYTLLRTWFETAPSDVSINETHNSFIRRECDRNRHISLPLLSSRCNARYDLKLHTLGSSVSGTHGGKNSRRWSKLRPAAFHVLQAGSGPTAQNSELNSEPPPWSKFLPSHSLVASCQGVALVEVELCKTVL